jgi:hypothetical protein
VELRPAVNPGSPTITTDDRLRIEFLLLNGDVRSMTLGSHTGSIGNALDRLQDWIETDGGTWIQKRYIVEATVVRRPDDPAA